MWNAACGAWLVGLLAMSGCGTAKPASVTGPTTGGAESALPVQAAALAEATVIELAKLRSDPASFEWFQFKPGVKKLILSGTPESRHVSVLWYTADDGKPGMVPLHYHAKTESIFVVDGAQADPKGKYEKGSFYFNPPGSGHNVFDSAGLFLLSYAAPPDFKKTDAIGAYEPLLVGADYAQLAFTRCADGSQCKELALAADGGMSARFVKPQAKSAVFANVLLVLQGSCTIDGKPVAADTLVVTKSTDPASYQVAPGADCLLFELAFK
jgi:hypothetical protein